MPSQKITLRWIETASLSDAELLALGALLSPKERERAARLRLAEDRRSFTAAHVLARALLAERGGRPALSWEFATGPFGKPAPICAQGEPDLRFNLSHTKGLAVVAIVEGREIGVDVENLDRRAPLEVVDRFFSPEERALLRSTGTARQSERFFALWTLKEAYLKALGRGMDLPLQSFAFDLDPIRLLYSREDSDPPRWRFHLSEACAGRLLALAVEWPEGEALALDAAPLEAQALVA